MTLMYDALELGDFVKDADGKITLQLNNNVEKTWLPYIFELAYDSNFDMGIVLNEWKKERVFPKSRYGSKKLLRQLGINKYDIDEILKRTNYSVLTDPYWISNSTDETYTKCSVRGKQNSAKLPYNSLEIKNESDFKWRI